MDKLLKTPTDCDNIKIEDGKKMNVGGTKSNCSRTVVLSGLCGCLLIIDMLLMGLVIFLFTSRSKNEQICHEPTEFCIPCRDIQLSPGEDKHNFAIFGYNRVDEGKSGECCAKNTENLKKLLKLFVDRKQRIQRLNQIQDREKQYPMTSFGGLPASKPAAHLVGRETPISTTEDGILKTVLWEAHHHPAFLHGNITVPVSGAMVTVSEAGYYYIYTQVIFERGNNATSGTEELEMPNKMCHFLYRSNGRENGADQQKLLENAQSGYTSVGEKSSTYSSYIGAVFYLYEQDSVLVKVTHPNLVKSNKHGHFFGLYMV